MAQWSHADRTLYTKIVYYGPALGGKTTNLHALHRMTDPGAIHRMLSLSTADDRTLFFDLLPFELGSILGYKVAIKLYTVPGQVRYEATRRVVLSGADAVVFVADSSPGRESDNRRSFEDLRQNMRANRLEPASVPVLVQLNKRDLPGVAPEASMASWFPGARAAPRPAIALDGRGVLETFVDACKAMLERLVAHADERTRRDIDPDDLERQIDRAFAPHVARAAEGAAPPGRAGERADAIVLEDHDLLRSAVRSSMTLGDDLANASSRLARLESEADAMRRLGDAVRASGASFDASAIVDGALRAACDVLGAPCVSLLCGAGGSISCEGSWGRGEDPLTSCAAGAGLARAVFAQPSACVVECLADDAPDVATSPGFEGLRALAAIPVGGDPPRRLVAWAAGPDGRFEEADLRFLDTLAAHLAVGLDKARLYRELAGSRERLEGLVRNRTLELRTAYDELRALETTKGRFLSSVSHEMRSPLTAIVGAASFLGRYDGSRDERREMVDAVLRAARKLEGLIDGLFRVARLERDDAEPRRAETSAAELLAEAVRLAGLPRAGVEVDPRLGAFGADAERLARALANLLDNAAKFAPADAPIEAAASACTLRRGSEQVAAVAFSVLDRGPGVAADELERIFAPFEQGGEILTDKPSGVGLGLYEARLIARQHGGILRYASREGGGSEFRLIVPAVPVAADVATPGAGAAWGGRR